MPWCPDCRPEYDPGIAKCVDCEVELVEELPEIRIGPPPVVVYKAATAFEAQIVEATLDSAGVEAFVQPTSVAWPGESITDFGSPDLLVLVPADRLLEAQSILKEQAVGDED